MFRSLRSAAFVAVVLALAGCGDSGVRTFPVTGRVRLADGTPVQTGIVEFTSADRVNTARGKIDRDGNFEFSAVEGDHLAVVIQRIMTEDLPLHKHDHGPTVDPDFAHYRRSGLSFHVDAEDENNFDVVVRAIEVANETHAQEK